MSDNKTAISHINKKGGTRGEEMVLNDIAVDIWLICQEYQVHISAAHIPGKDDVTEDIASREFIDSAEWMISPNVCIFPVALTQCAQPQGPSFPSKKTHKEKKKHLLAFIC